MHRSYGLQGSLKRRYKHPSPTSINGYHTAKKLLSQSPAKRPTFAFADESGYTHSPLPTGSHTAAYTPKQGLFRMGALLLPSERFTHFGNPAWPGVRTAYFAALGSWSETLLKNAESLRSSDALMRVAAPRHRGPAGLRCPVAAAHSARFSGIERLDQAFWQSYYHTQQPNGQPFGACVGAASGSKMRAITLDFKESHHGRT